jgi:hypothetical protein
MTWTDLAAIPAAAMNVLLDIPDWSGIREKLAKHEIQRSQSTHRPH